MVITRPTDIFSLSILCAGLKSNEIRFLSVNDEQNVCHKKPGVCVREGVRERVYVLCTHVHISVRDRGVSIICHVII